MNLDQLNAAISTPQAALEKAVELFGDRLTLASSLGLEDQLLTHYLLTINPKAQIFVLDTGRLHPETYDVMAKTEAKYAMRYQVYYPNPQPLEAMVRSHGINLFYESIENRKRCCQIRKVEPLKRALADVDAWITGLRRAQSVTRLDLQIFEHADAHNIVKINPLANFSETDVRDEIKAHDVPYNVLHDHGFPSIGCAPCTRAIAPGDDVRAGRWWWEQPEQKECGLHLVDGKLVPKKGQ